LGWLDAEIHGRAGFSVVRRLIDKRQMFGIRLHWPSRYARLIEKGIAQSKKIKNKSHDAMLASESLYNVVRLDQVFLPSSAVHARADR